MNISFSNDEQSKVDFIVQNKKCFFRCPWRRTLPTGSLEVDASHLHGIGRVMGHHLGVAQKALGSRFRVFALTAEIPVSQKSN